MDKLSAMKAFVRVAEAGSFAAVAVQLGLARSVVTRQVAALESTLGTKLIARSTRRLALTSAGALYLEKCREILTLVEEAEGELTDARRHERGDVVIGMYRGAGPGGRGGRGGAAGGGGGAGPAPRGAPPAAAAAKVAVRPSDENQG